jgi:SAM-dependent methyltransferase
MFDPSWTHEQHRLALIEHCYDPATQARLNEIGVGSGWRCLEAGAGNGSIARWLRDRVGPEGRVVAIDLDTQHFDNDPGIEARRADILTCELEQGAYDLVHCRALLHHLPGRQVDALRRMAASLRPGGLLFAEDPWLGTMLGAATPEYVAAWKAVVDVAPADYLWAVGLPYALQAAGLVDVDASAETDFARGGSPLAELVGLTIGAVRPRIPAGVDIDAGIDLMGDPTSFEPGPVWYAAWGRRP